MFTPPEQKRRSLGSLNGGGPSTADWRARLVRVYEHSKPEKLHSTDKVLTLFEGREDQLRRGGA